RSCSRSGSTALTWPPERPPPPLHRPDPARRPGSGGGPRAAVPGGLLGGAPRRPHQAPRRPAPPRGGDLLSRRPPGSAGRRPEGDGPARDRRGDRPVPHGGEPARRAPPHLDDRDQLSDPPVRRPGLGRAALAGLTA